MANSFQDRIRSESRATVQMSNNDMVCKDCLLRYDDSSSNRNTTRCEAYQTVKPYGVLAGGECDEYVKE